MTATNATKQSALEPPSDWGVPGFSARAAILLGLTFLPYVALPLGDNSHVSLASLVAFIYTREVLARPRILVPFLVVAATPTLMLFVEALFDVGDGSAYAAAVLSGPPLVNPALWVLHVAPFGAVAAAVAVSQRTVRLTVRVLLLAAAGYVVVQKFFLDNGVLPFIWMYDVPGYWSVPENVEEIVEYVRRPFGWFPEPSFMAGTLALATMALLILGYAADRRLPILDLLTVTTVGVAMVLSQSGSALLTLPILAALALLPFSSRPRRLCFLILGVGLWVLLTSEVLESRNSLTNYSWADRWASIIAGGNYLLEHGSVLLAGVGVGESAALYQSGQIPLDGLVVSRQLLDIFSVSGSMVLANGVLGSAAMLAALLVPIVRAFAVRLSWMFGLLAVFAWLIVSGLTISYDSASWIWAFPGVCLGMLAADKRTGCVAEIASEETASMGGRVPR